MDPNAIYKSGFQALTDKLGRLPRVTDPEWLELGNEYSRSYSQERDTRLAEEAKASRVASAAAGRPEPARFSREPAPQARIWGPVPSSTRIVTEVSSAREGTGWREALDAATTEGLSGPRINAEPTEAEREPERSAVNPRPSERLTVGTRGPGGGIVAACRKCGSGFERPARAGRPPVVCEECR